MLVYFMVVVDVVELLLIIYNILGWIGVKMEILIVLILVEYFNIVGIK